MSIDASKEGHPAEPEKHTIKELTALLADNVDVTTLDGNTRAWVECMRQNNYRHAIDQSQPLNSEEMREDKNVPKPKCTIHVVIGCITGMIKKLFTTRISDAEGYTLADFAAYTGGFLNDQKKCQLIRKQLEIPGSIARQWDEFIKRRNAGY